MTRRLILMRHAKSSWGDPTKDDHARPLNGRGRQAATAMGNWLRAKDYLPYRVLSSSSARTRETCARLGLDSETVFLDKLYHANPSAMLQVLRGAKGACVLMLGHNPGIAWLARELVATAPVHPRFGDYPTCATLVADFEITDWAYVQPGTGTAIDFVIPRELTDT